MSEAPMPQKNSNEVEVRKLLLDFYSSEIESHSNLIIGLAVVLFTTLEFFPKPQSGTEIYNTQSCIGVIIIWVISGSLWYFLMRHFSYGILCNSAISASLDSGTSPFTAASKVRVHASKSKILLFFPSNYFITGKGYVKYVGWILCYFVFGSLTTSLLLLLIGFKA
jgi:hypothetical protein